MSEKKEEERQTATGYIMQEEHIAYSRHCTCFLRSKQYRNKGLYVIYNMLKRLLHTSGISCFIQTIILFSLKDFESYYQKDNLHTKGILFSPPR